MPGAQDAETTHYEIRGIVAEMVTIRGRKVRQEREVGPFLVSVVAFGIKDREHAKEIAYKQIVDPFGMYPGVFLEAVPVSIYAV